VGDNRLQQGVTGTVGQPERAVDLLPGAHHLPGIADPQLAHHGAQFHFGGRFDQVLDDLRLHALGFEETPGRATL
jgi:hypothetical protein